MTDVTDTAQLNTDTDETIYVALSAAVGVLGIILGLVVGIVVTVLLMRNRRRKGV